MNYSTKRKLTAIFVAVIMLLQMSPVTVLASAFDATTGSFSVASLGDLNDGGTIGSVTTQGSSATISVGGKVTFTTVNMQTLFAVMLVVQLGQHLYSQQFRISGLYHNQWR